MDLEEALSNPESPADVKRNKPNIPKAGEPGTWEWDGNQGVINTQPTLERLETYDDFLKDAFPGVDPADLEVIEPVQVRGWDTNTGEGNIVRMHYYRLNVRRKRNGMELTDLLDLVKKSPAKKATSQGSSTFVVALGDLQLGKIDGDGAAGTIERVVQGIEQAAVRIKELQKSNSIGTIHLAFLGDCIEGFVSQGGTNTWRTSLTPTEQIKVLRRVMMFAVQQLSPLADTMTAIAIPGNHDQGIRFGKGGVTRYDDSFDVDALSAVADACALKPEAFGHVSFHTPDIDEMTITLETSGTIIGHAHGHQMTRSKHFAWWSAQSFGDYPVGQADLLLTGHFHHFMLEQSGKRTFIQVPALESESTWYRHRSGEGGNPGVLTFLTHDKKISSIEVV